VGVDFAANLQELSLSNMTQWRIDTDHRSHRDEELIAIEKLKHEDMLRLDREKLELERERLELQRRADERKREKVEIQRRAKEERILAIDVDSVTNSRFRAYYKKLQDDIMSKVNLLLCYIDVIMWHVSLLVLRDLVCFSFLFKL
jgi:hypothetical protein